MSGWPAGVASLLVGANTCSEDARVILSLIGLDYAQSYHGDSCNDSCDTDIRQLDPPHQADNWDKSTTVGAKVIDGPTNRTSTSWLSYKTTKNIIITYKSCDDNSFSTQLTCKTNVYLLDNTQTLL